MTKKITKEQYWQITGLLALAERAVIHLKDIECSIRSILEVRKADEGRSGIGHPGHIEDAVFSSYSVDMLLEKLGISPPKL